VAEIDLPLNFEMAATQEMLDIALRHKPHAACIVPEKREERTTEGGLDVVRAHDALAPYVRQLSAAGIRVSLFIEPDRAALEAARSLGAPVVELHTGAYCEAWLHAPNGARIEKELDRIVDAAAVAESLGIECHAGHGLTFDTVAPVASVPTIVELNLGHFLVGEAIFSGLESAIKRMRSLMDKARAEASGERSA
jgi:pyridoxine 5-phosphate synthase